MNLRLLVLGCGRTYWSEKSTCTALGCFKQNIVTNINSILSVWSAYFSLRRGCTMVMKCCMGSLVTLLRPIHLLSCRAVHPLCSNQIKSTETIFKRQLFMRKALIVFSLHMSLSSIQFCRNPFRKIHFLYFHLSKDNGSTFNRTRFPFWWTPGSAHSYLSKQGNINY